MLTFKSIIGTIFIFFYFQQSVLAQSYKNYEMDTHSQVILGIVLILIATIFIGLTILDNPKYTVAEPIEKKVKINVIKTSTDIKYVLDNRILYLFKMGFYTIVLLSAIYLVIMFLMLKIF